MADPVYPRPDFDRSHAWLSLDGAWDFAADADGSGYRMNWHAPACTAYDRTINVPFPWESPLSGIAIEWMPIGWYRRTIERPSAWAGLRTILHIGAAHYHTSVWIDGNLVGDHTGGYLPFAFDITDYLTDGRGVLTLRVEAPLDKRYIPHGKQRSRPSDDWDDCAFTASSGIGQSVWLEARPATYIAHVALRPTRALDGVEAVITLAGPAVHAAQLSAQIKGAETRMAVAAAAHVEVVLPIPNPQRWTPASPVLYFIDWTLESADGMDQVRTYTGLRKIEVQGDQLFLNGERLYIRGVLDQGFWPEGIYAAPDDAALRRDVALARAAGFNLARKHIKLEHPRWLYWADVLGLLVWEEPPCFGRFTPTAAAEFEALLPSMVARDGNHPCIIIWGIYNEEWGLDWAVAASGERRAALERAYDLLRLTDNTRPIVDNSGWNHVKSDLVDWHYYDMDMRSWQATAHALAQDSTAWFAHQLSTVRFSQTQLNVPADANAGKPILNGEYGGGFPHNQGWLFRWQTLDLRRHDRFAGYVYTEFTDVEYEVVGIYDAQRRLKALGCNPADLNADTVILFDLVPVAPGKDYVAAAGHVSLEARVSHHGCAALRGVLAWGWAPGAEHAGACAICIDPFVLSEPISIGAQLPTGQAQARLHVWLSDAAGARRAYSFLDIEAAQS